MPYKIAFIDNDPYDGWWYTDIVIDALFLTDVLVNLSSAFYNADGELVVNR